jgi:hypothetical protein
MLKLLKYRFDLALAILTLLSTVLMFIASSDPVPAAIQNTDLHSFLKQFATGNQIIFDLSVGILAGVFIYYLVVRVPERGRRHRIRRNLAMTHSSCKSACNAVYLGCFMKSYPVGLPEELTDMARFRQFFKEEHVAGQTKWDAVANGLTDEKLKDLVVELEILMQEVHFTLSAVDIKDPKAFGFLKSLSRILYRSKNWTTDYDSTKSLLGFLWSFHTGWSWVEGYLPTDPIAEMIAAV